MTITSSGVRCDVCGMYVLPLDPEERVHTFSVKGIEQKLHCDNKCAEILEKATKTGDWKQLPRGPLRKTFEDTKEK